MLRWIVGALLILAGLAVTTHGWWSGFEEAGGQRILTAEARAAVAHTAASLAAGPGSAVASPAATARGAAAPSLPPPPPPPILAPLGHWRPPGPTPQVYASLAIPAIGLSALVVRGASLTDYYDLLAWGPAHLRGSPEPGGLGNAVIFGHVDEFGSPFRALDRLRPGDAIDLAQSGGRYVYSVRWVRLVPATDLGIVDSRPGVRALTLFTCGGPANSDRVAVRATLAKSEMAPRAERRG